MGETHYFLVWWKFRVNVFEKYLGKSFQQRLGECFWEIFRQKFGQGSPKRVGGMFLQRFLEIFRQKFLQSFQQRLGECFWEIFRRIFEQGSPQKFSTKFSQKGWGNVFRNI